MCMLLPMTALKLQLNNEIIIWRMIWRLVEHNSYNLGYKEETKMRLASRAEMQNRLIPHSCMVVEHWEVYLCCGAPFGGMRGINPRLGLPSSGLQCWEKESSQNLVIKISGDSGLPGEMEGSQKSRCPFKGHVHRLTHLQAFTLDSSEEKAAWKVPETCRERLRCVGLETGLE